MFCHSVRRVLRESHSAGETGPTTYRVKPCTAPGFTGRPAAVVCDPRLRLEPPIPLPTCLRRTGLPALYAASYRVKRPVRGLKRLPPLRNHLYCAIKSPDAALRPRITPAGNQVMAGPGCCGNMPETL